MDSKRKQSLKGKVAVVVGATRGAGRGIACMLGEAGATVYCTGRSTRATRAAQAARTAQTTETTETAETARTAQTVSATQTTPEGQNRPSGESNNAPAATAADDRASSPFDLERRPETIEETAEMVEAFGGVGIPVQVDHTVEEQVEALFARIRRKQGRLDILVNDIWGGDALTEWDTPFWRLSMEKGRLMLERAVFAHIMASRYGAPLMVEARSGLIVEITDGDTDAYRGNLFYDLAKMSAIRLAKAMAEELRPYNVTAVAVTPGFLRSEAVLDHLGVTEANWQEGAKRDPHFIASETPYYVGRAVATLAADPDVFSKSGGTYTSWGHTTTIKLRRLRSSKINNRRAKGKLP